MTKLVHLLLKEALFIHLVFLYSLVVYAIFRACVLVKSGKQGLDDSKHAEMSLATSGIEKD